MVLTIQIHTLCKQALLSYTDTDISFSEIIFFKRLFFLSHQKYLYEKVSKFAIYAAVLAITSVKQQSSWGVGPCSCLLAVKREARVDFATGD